MKEEPSRLELKVREADVPFLILSFKLVQNQPFSERTHNPSEYVRSLRSLFAPETLPATGRRILGRRSNESGMIFHVSVLVFS